MASKVEKKIEENQAIAETNVSTALEILHKNSGEQQSWMLLGAFSAVNNISEALKSQTIRGLQRFRDEKLYEPLGYARFDTFLDEFENSPMNYKKFNEQENLLKKEGDAGFDVLSNLKLSMRQRKLLGAGYVQIEGDKVIVTTGDFGEEETQEIQIDDRARLLQTLSALADQNARLNITTNKQTAALDKSAARIKTLSEDLETAKTRPGQTSIETVEFESYMRAVNALNALAQTVNELTIVQRLTHDETYLKGLWTALCHVRSAYGRNDLSFNDSPTPEGEFPDVTTLNDEQLADLM